MSYPHLPDQASLHHRLTVRQVRAIAVLLCFTVSLSLLWFIPNALADEQSPDAPGMITGRITDQDGAPLGNIYVTLYWTVNNTQWYRTRTTQTQADGRYRFSLIDAGIYRIGAADELNNFAPTFYPAAPYLETAAELTIVGNTLENIDMTLLPGGVITGVITNTAAGYAGLREVRLYEKLTSNPAAGWQVVKAAYLGAELNQYQLRGLHTGRYRLCATAFTINFECYDNVYNVENALDLTVTAGVTLSAINIAFGGMTDVAQINGRVTAMAGTPLGDIEVIALPVPTPLPDNTPTPYPTPEMPGPQPTPTGLPYPSPMPATSSDYGAYYTHTTASGDYQLPALPPGAYQLQFRDPTGNYASEYYNDVHTIAQALPLDVAERTALSNVNAQLSPGAHITGVVTVLGQPVRETLVGLYEQTATGWRFVTSVQVNAFSGQYSIDGLAAGVYRLSAYASRYDAVGDVISGGIHYWGAYGGNRLEEGSNITLTSGETKTAINLNLTNGPQFNSAIVGRVMSGGSPVPGIKVALYAGGCCFVQPLVYVYSDQAGRYAIQGLSSGDFQVAFFDPAGVYARTFYKDQWIGSKATTLKLKEDETQTADVDLVQGGAFGGTVRTVTGQPIPDLYVMVYIYFDNRYELLANDVRTDANGNYRITGLQPGHYQVCFERSLWTYSGECYATPEGWSAPPYAGPQIEVVAGKLTNDIDLLWGPDRHFYLPIIGR